MNAFSAANPLIGVLVAFAVLMLSFVTPPDYRDLARERMLPPVSMRVNPPAGFDGQDARASARLGRATLLAA